MLQKAHSLTNSVKSKILIPFIHLVKINKYHILKWLTKAFKNSRTINYRINK
jgi:hypothetical protein